MTRQFYNKLLIYFKKMAILSTKFMMDHFKTKLEDKVHSTAFGKYIFSSVLLILLVRYNQ